MTFKLAECSIRETALLEYLDLALNTDAVVEFHFKTLWLLLKFFSTTARSFYDNHFNYRLIFSSLL